MLRQLINNLTSSFATLSSRERRLVMIAGAVLSLFIVFLVTWNFSSSADAIRKRTQSKLSRLEEVQELAATYRDAKGVQEAFELRLASSNVRLISYLEDKGNKAGLSIPSINPKADVSGRVSGKNACAEQPPNNALLTGATTGLMTFLIHSAVSRRITLATSAGSIATQP